MGDSHWCIHNFALEGMENAHVHLIWKGHHLVPHSPHVFQLRAIALSPFRTEYNTAIDMEKLRLDSTHDLEVTSSLLARAMCERASWSYIFGTGETTNLSWVFKRYLALHSGHTYIRRDNSGEIFATCTIRPPNLKITSWQKVRNGLLLFPIYFGFDAFARMEELDAFFNSDTNIAKGSYYVTSLAVCEDKRGCGIGYQFLRDILDDAVPTGSTVALNTENFRNVGFYQRIGFTVVDERKLQLKYPGLTSIDTDWSIVMQM